MLLSLAFEGEKGELFDTKSIILGICIYVHLELNNNFIAIIHSIFSHSRNAKSLVSIILRSQIPIHASISLQLLENLTLWDLTLNN